MQFQFSLRRMLLSVTLIALAAGCTASSSYQMLNPEKDNGWFGLWAFIQTLAIGPLIGAALLTFVGRIRIGAYIGFFVPIVLVIGLAISIAGWRLVASEPVAVVVIALTIFAMLLGMIATYAALRARRLRRAR